jgi:hypothetical protein
LAEDLPTSSAVGKGVGRVIEVTAIADTASATERVQELLIGLKRRKLGKHSSIVCGANSSGSLIH